MILDKPYWVNHNGARAKQTQGTAQLARHSTHPRYTDGPVKYPVVLDLAPAGNPIWSIDIDHEGKRVVTAGSDHKIKVWAAGPILSANAEANAAQPRLLATISDHITAVNVARFSPVGHFIASGCDGHNVLIHQLLPGKGLAQFGTKDAPNIENWRQVHQMRGHTCNVQDIAWCPDGTKLASCSLDNHVIVWDASTGRQITVLSGHEGHVKGVSWDPFDRYVASHGDKGGLIIWSTADWSLVSRVSAPWANSKGSSAFHTRSSWSPDGQTICATAAYSKPVYQAPLVRRNEWQSSHQLCGHKNWVCAAKFNPHLFYKDPESDEARGICALGSLDRMFTVWAIDKKKPIVIMKDMFGGSVMDFAWTPDGMTLLAASYDGTIATVSFTEAELGRRLPRADMEELVAKLYGTQGNKKRALVTDAQLLALENEGPDGAAAVAQRTAALNARIGPGNGTLAGNAVAAAAPQPAKKRVAPMQVGGAPAPLPPPAPAPAAAPATGAAAPVVARPAIEAAPPARRVAPQPAAAAAAAAAAPAPAAQAVNIAVAAAPDALVLVPPPASQNTLFSLLGTREVLGGLQDGQQETVNLEAHNNLRLPGAGQTKTARLQCTVDGRSIWFDHVPGPVTQITGTLNFSAASLSNGDLLIFSAAGRRLFPPICVGGQAAFMSHNDGWLLLVLTTQGNVRLWDVQTGTSKLNVSLGPVLQNCKSTVTAVRILSSGGPLITLANRHAYTYSDSLQAWCRVGDDSFAASQFHTTFSSMQGELGRVQADAAAARSARDVVGAAFTQPPHVQTRAVRAHMEHSIAAAKALQSPYEWKRHLISYARMLASDGDEARLRELVHELLGPIRYHPSTHPSQEHDWSPTELGHNKRTLLRNDIVREIARPRTAPLQALAKEALDLLREADSCWDATFATGLADRGNAALNGAPAPRGADGAALKGVAGNAGLLGQGDVVMRDAGEGARRDGAGGVTGVTLGGLGSGGPGASLSGWLQT